RELSARRFVPLLADAMVHLGLAQRPPPHSGIDRRSFRPTGVAVPGGAHSWSKRWPQKRQSTAAALISSAHIGHVFVAGGVVAAGAAAGDRASGGATPPGRAAHRRRNCSS